MVLVKNWQLFATFLYQQKRPGKCVYDIFNRKNAFLDCKDEGAYSGYQSHSVGD